MSTSPEVTQALTSLAELALKNSASAISTRIQASRAKGRQEETVNELVDIVNDLLEDRGRLIGLARELEGALVAQRITDAEIQYITDQIIPTVENVAGLTADGENAEAVVDLLKTLVTSETLTVLQLVGFNFKAAIGEPLTELTQKMILSQAPQRVKAATRPQTGNSNKRR